MKIPNNLVILEMANNHMGSLDHALRIIEDFSVLIKEFPEFNFCFKMQYRDLDTFIRPDYRGRLDIKHVKRFEETKLSRDEQKKIAKEIKSLGFISMCTPFDNASISRIVEDGYDIIKVASCSCGDWPLLDDIVLTSLPIVASVGGASLELIDDLILYLTNRKKDFLIQHCVGEYPTPIERMNLNQLDFLRQRHDGVRFGFSTHEDPSDTNLVRMAIAKGAVSLEKHVGVPTESWPLNAYSSNLDQTRNWLEAARQALLACGTMGARYVPSQVETDSLVSLQRGAFLRVLKKAGETISLEDVYFAFPPSDGQVTASDFSKYSVIKTNKDLKEEIELLKNDITIKNNKLDVLNYANDVVELIIRSGVVVPKKVDLEISHHYGLERFREFGLSMITLVNREYCKKLLVCLPEQFHPEQYHLKKEETFHVLFGDLELTIDGKKHHLSVGDVVTILPEQRHSFISRTGAVVEEISSTHFKDDSYYVDTTIQKNSNRKSIVHWVF